MVFEGENHGVIHEQKYTKKKPNLSNLKVFDCIYYFHILKEERNKLKRKSREHLFVGYNHLTKVYRVYKLEKTKALHNIRCYI
uniref:Retroviral polymerase SH3-like domain-containing protein n=1 Tax=Physcomitrium patens TaxID=3218 RepID=A0A2K1JXJ8_PHYPA|nr:hypothetical protein PHYPA_013369 [Physcomitrium patens]